MGRLSEQSVLSTFGGQRRVYASRECFSTAGPQQLELRRPVGHYDFLSLSQTQLPRWIYSSQSTLQGHTSGWAAGARSGGEYLFRECLEMVQPLLIRVREQRICKAACVVMLMVCMVLPRHAWKKETKKTPEIPWPER